MAEVLETAEIQLDVVGAEAVQQTLDAIGAKTAAVSNDADQSQTPAPSTNAASLAPQPVQPDPAATVRQVLDAIGARGPVPALPTPPEPPPNDAKSPQQTFAIPSLTDNKAPEQPQHSLPAAAPAPSLAQWIAQPLAERPTERNNAPEIATPAHSGEIRLAAASPPAPEPADFTALAAAIDRTNSLLERIAAAVEKEHPPMSHPTY